MRIAYKVKSERQRCGEEGTEYESASSNSFTAVTKTSALEHFVDAVPLL